MDWHKIFTPQTPVLEIVLRGSIMYLALYFLLRVILKRQSGTTGITDLLVIVLIADAAQNGMAGQYNSITDGLVLVATIIAWSFLLDLIAYWVPPLRRVIESRPLPLVKDGELVRRNMRRELITEDELWSQLRQQGIQDLSKVRRMYMEPDGQFSVVTGNHHPRKREKEAF